MLRFSKEDSFYYSHNFCMFKSFYHKEFFKQTVFSNSNLTLYVIIFQ